MLQHWIESVIIKRAILALAAGSVSYLAAHAIPDLSPYLNHLASVGLSINIQITDPEKLRQAIEILLLSFAQGAHEWIAAKYPELGKYL
jgi:hypothetical protein